MPSHTNDPLDVAEPQELTDPERAEREITAFVRETVEAAGADGVIVCLSGGIDSTVSATLAVEALHRGNVYGLLLPADSTQPGNVEDARTVARDLGIDHRQVDIQPILDRFVETVATEQAEVRPDPFSERTRRISTSPVEREHYREAVGNTAARLRMATAYFEASTTNRLVLGTGNRTELLLGYFTKYGDGGVDLLPIGDLYKTEVRQLAEYLGVPERIIEKPPTAGLWEGQTDENELGATYETIDAVLASIADDRRSIDATAAALDMKPSFVARFADMVDRSEHKRIPPLTPTDRALLHAEGSGE